MQLSWPQELPSDTPLQQSGGAYLMTSPSVGQVVYVPAYSHVYESEGKPYLLTTTLSIRNVSMEHELIVKAIRYFDTRGIERRSFLKKPVRLQALGTTEVLVERSDVSGGSGANFLVEWYATSPVNAPVIEAVMIDTTSQQGISFARRGVVINELSLPTMESAERNDENL